MKIDEIKTIVKLMSDNDLTEFKIESDEMTLCLRRAARQQSAPAPVFVTAAVPAAAAPAVAISPAAVPAVQEPAKAAPVSAGHASPDPAKVIESPTVGTFYRSSAPGAEPFVKVGSHVEPDTTVAVVEAMKVMNEIKAEKSGVIKEILLENGQPVEYGQPLFVLE
ncbi:MAG: acetyl-CoA carboxylase biotin carboxyl carrier protein [Lentisphaeria bacterium]|nr:acetyl-CoA carboxylase biotin carboxyl carrier protein [Lentisphaeria bacterium]